MKQNSHRLAQRRTVGGSSSTPSAFAFGTFDLVDDLFAVGQPRLDDQLVVRREELPVEEVGELAPVDRERARSPARSPTLRAMLPSCTPFDANHSTEPTIAMGETTGAISPEMTN